MLFSKSWAISVIAFVVRDLKEFGEPTRKAMIVDLSIAGAQARTVGVYYFQCDFTVEFVAFVDGWPWMISPAVNLWMATDFGLIGTVVFAMFGKEAHHKRGHQRPTCLQ